MKVVLDTHILLWFYLDHASLPERYRAHLLDRQLKNEPVGVSVMSLWEVAQLVDRGRISFRCSVDEWFSDLAKDPWLEVLPLTPQSILESFRLGPTFQKDPADRLIVATARTERAQLMTVDERIIRSKSVAVF